MKYLYIFFLFSVVLSAQNKIIIDERTQKPMVVGFGDRSVFEDSTFVDWYKYQYENYKISEVLDDISSDDLRELKITIVLGTWCGDSKREVPRFYKVLDHLSFPEDYVELIFVDRKKQGLENEVEDLKIEFVPTMIFYRNDEELGRIIETPIETLEEDFRSIIK